MSPKSKSRKKKQVHRPREERSPFGPLLATVAGLGDAPSPLQAEMWASELYGSVWLGAWDSEAEDPAESCALEVEDLIAGLAETGGPAALVALRGFSGIGEEWLRELATEVADNLAMSGVPEPAWYDRRSHTEFREARLVSDLFGDFKAVAVAFQRGDERTTILFFVEAVFGLDSIQLFNTPDEGLDALLRDMIESVDGTLQDEIRHLSGTQAWELVWPLLHAFFEEPPDEGAHAALLEDEDAEHPAQLVALAQAWIALLEPEDPAEPDTRAGTVVEAFLASPHAQALPDHAAVRRFAEIATEAAVDDGREPDECGPLAMSALLVADFAASLHISDADLALFPDMVRAWAYFTSENRGLPRDEARARWDETLPVVLTDFDDALRDPNVARDREGTFRQE